MNPLCDALEAPAPTFYADELEPARTLADALLELGAAAAELEQCRAELEAQTAAADCFERAVESNGRLIDRLNDRVAELEALTAVAPAPRARRAPAKPKVSRHVRALLKERFPAGVAEDSYGIARLAERQRQLEDAGAITPALRAQFTYKSRDRSMPDEAVLGAIVNGYTLSTGKAK